MGLFGKSKEEKIKEVKDLKKAQKEALKVYGKQYDQFMNEIKDLKRQLSQNKGYLNDASINIDYWKGENEENAEQRQLAFDQLFEQKEKLEAIDVLVNGMMFWNNDHDIKLTFCQGKEVDIGPDHKKSFEDMRGVLHDVRKTIHPDETRKQRKKGEDVIKESKVFLTKKIEKALKEIDDFKKWEVSDKEKQSEMINIFEEIIKILKE